MMLDRSGSLVLVVLVIVALPFFPMEESVHQDIPADGSLGSTPLMGIGPEISVPLSVHGSAFIRNEGQLEDPSVGFIAQGSRLSAVFRAGTVDLVLREGGAGGEESWALLTIGFEGGNPVEPEGLKPLKGLYNYMLGRDPDGWTLGVTRYSQVLYRDLWDGVDLRYYFDRGLLKYEFIVRSGTSPETIAMVYDGCQGLSVDGVTGDLIISTPHGHLRDYAPIALQRTTIEERSVDASFEIVEGRTVHFEVGHYDQDRDLIIDPGFVFSTLIGGDGDERVPYMFMDEAGYIYLTGGTNSPDFPSTPGAYSTQHTSQNDVYVMKLAPNATRVEWSTFIGGTRDEGGVSIKVDESGRSYVAVRTRSTDFPTTSGAYNESLNGTLYDIAFLILDETGSSLLYSTFMGGTGEEYLMAMDVGPEGYVYMAGYTQSTDLPLTPDAIDRTYDGYREGFIMVLDHVNSSLVHSTYLGGEGGDYLQDMILLGRGRVLVAGRTSSNDFPTTPGAFSTSRVYSSDGFITDVDLTGGTILHSTYIGGEDQDEITAIDLALNGDVVFTGETRSYDYPTTSGAYSEQMMKIQDNEEIFVSKMTSDLSTLVSSTFVGGYGRENGKDVHVHTNGDVYVVGWSNSRTFPTTENANRSQLVDNSDGILMVLSNNLTELIYSSFFGGESSEYGYQVLIDTDECPVVVGYTHSEQFYTTPGALDRVHNGSTDVFLFKSDELVRPVFGDDGTTNNTTTGDLLAFDVDVLDNKGVSSGWVDIWYDDGPDPLRHILTLTSGSSRNGTWGRDIRVDANTTGPLHYQFLVEDGAGNLMRTEQRDVKVIDNDAPEFSEVRASPAVAGERLMVKVNVADNIQVRSVNAICWFDGDPSRSYNVTMFCDEVGPRGDGMYILDRLFLGRHVTDALTFYIEAVDLSGNWNQSGTIRSEVLDRTPPSIRLDDSDEDVRLGEDFHWSIVVEDNIGLYDVRVVYWIGENATSSHNSTMKGEGLDSRGNGTYSMSTMTVPTRNRYIFYYFQAVDNSGNWVTTPVVRVEIKDLEGPRIIADTTDSTAMTGEDLRFALEVMDNIGIASVEVRYWYQGSAGTTLVMSAYSIQGLGNGTYETTLAIPADAFGTLSYIFTIMDVLGNTNSSALSVREILDAIPPWIVRDTSDKIAYKGEPFTFRMEPGDNTWISEAWVTYRIGEDFSINESMVRGHDFHLEVVVPRKVTGDLQYTFWVCDRSGNWISSAGNLIPTVNAPPTMNYVPLMVVAEGEESTFDLEPYIWDGNDPASSIEITSDDARVTVNGLSIRVMATVWEPVGRLELTLSDGEAQTTVSLPLMIINRNDPPRDVRILSPRHGLEVEFGSNITFEATFSDPDADIGIELEVIWSIQGSDLLARTVGSGSKPFDLSSLPPGTYTVVLSVSDGEVQEEHTVEITILFETPRDVSRGPSHTTGSLLFIVAIAVVSVFTAIRIAKGRRCNVDSG